jgi:hypothetical protein
MPRLIVPSSGGGRKLMRTVRVGGVEVGSGVGDSWPRTVSEIVKSKAHIKRVSIALEFSQFSSFVILSVVLQKQTKSKNLSLSSGGGEASFREKREMLRLRSA